MNQNNELIYNNLFQKKLSKIILKDSRLYYQIKEVCIKINNNPFEYSLKTHRVNSRKYGQVFASYVTGDIRILWKYLNNKVYIYIITFGGHSGAKSVY